MSSASTSKKFDNAVVIGASVAGLLAARVLADSFAHVTILDRDPLPVGPEHRKGNPQTRQTHGILKAGIDIMAELFPGIWEEMEADGSVRTDITGDWVWFHHGVWKSRSPEDLPTYCQTRPFLDWHIKRRLNHYENVTLVDACIVTSLVHDAARGRVTGVRVKRKNGGEEAMAAELVVDASGRGTKSPRWLEKLGYGRPPEKEIKTNLGYSTRLVKLLSAQKRDWTNMVILPKAPHQTKAGYIFPVEEDQWSVSLVGYLGDYPPADDEGFMAFAKQLPRPEFYAAIKDAEPLTPIATYRVASSLRRCYEKMSRFPEGYAVLGDAACSLNPVFGQGISVAALVVIALRQVLAKQPPGELFISRSFRTAAAKHCDVAWLLAATEDLRYPKTQGERFPGIELVHWYIGALLELASIDPQMNRLFFDVMSFQKLLTSMLVPSVALKVLRWSLGLGMQRPPDEMPRAIAMLSLDTPACGARINS